MSGARRIHTLEAGAAFMVDPVMLDLPDREAALDRADATAEAIGLAMAAMDSDVHGGQRILRKQADHMLRMSEALAAPVLAAEAQALSEQLDGFAYTEGARKALLERKYRYGSASCSAKY